MNTITLKKSKNIVRLKQDIYPESPRKMDDNLTTIYAEHKRYDFSEVKTYTDCQSWKEVYNNLIEEYKPVLIYPLYMYDHSYQQLSIHDFNDRWDSGQVGYIFITKEKIKEFFGDVEITDEFKKKLYGYLTDEIKTYNKYLIGEVYILAWYELYEDSEGHKIEDMQDYIGDIYLDSSSELPVLIKDFFNLNENEYVLEGVSK